MKIFLASCESYNHIHLTEIVGHKFVLFSYYHWMTKGAKERGDVQELWSRFPQEIICDSGLFTLMFGAGKGGSYDLSYMRDYTKKYLFWASQINHPNMTFVESDVHKLLGMPAVFELRKMFEDSGLNHFYVWHREEGIDGLFRMAEKYDYIALSVPELRILCKGKVRYQDAVKDLESKIYKNVKRLPKIHLLGNTVMETMKTNISYSCDSTSWLSGGRWGRYIHYENGKMNTKKLTDTDYLKTKYIFQTQYQKQYEAIMKRCKSEKSMSYVFSEYLSARSFNLYQGWLDQRYQCQAKKGLIV